ncbi:hypothetical protein [Litchfieldia alkalitelluris]|uniref:hypothetical protein n=1 Tax=Litchfieldia alkalitelluris TaxID=304268 RepID=UPI000B44E21B|nr:hypothetical protein [Litchfieldia alkalitelluris]
MSFYVYNYAKVLKKNFMLVIVALVLLGITFFIWTGIPIFFIGSAIAKVTSNTFIITLGITLSVGFLFSLYFIPINLKVASNVAEETQEHSVLVTFLIINVYWILASSFIFLMIFSVVFII